MVLLLYRDEDGIRLLGVGSPDGENTWWLEQHLGNSGQRHYCISQGVLAVLYGVTAAASPWRHGSSQPMGSRQQPAHCTEGKTEIKEQMPKVC